MNIRDFFYLYHMWRTSLPRRSTVLKDLLLDGRQYWKTYPPRRFLKFPSSHVMRYIQWSAKKCLTLNFEVSRRFLLRKRFSDVVSTTIRFVFEFFIDWWYFCPIVMKISLSPPKNGEFLDKMLGQFTVVIYHQIKLEKYIKHKN